MLATRCQGVSYPASVVCTAACCTVSTLDGTGTPCRTLRVNVMTSMEPGDSPCCNMWPTRAATTRVLPLPGPAGAQRQQLNSSCCSNSLLADAGQCLPMHRVESPLIAAGYTCPMQILTGELCTTDAPAMTRMCCSFANTASRCSALKACKKLLLVVTSATAGTAAGARTPALLLLPLSMLCRPP